MRRLLAGVIILVVCAVAPGQERPFGGRSVADWVKRLQDPKAESRCRDLEEVLFLTTTKVLTGSLPARGTEPALKERLKDPELRVHAALGLLRLDRTHPEAGAVWLEVVGNPKDKQRLVALSGINDSHLPKGGAELLRKLAQDEDPEFRYQAFGVLLRYGRTAVPVLREGVR